MLIGFCNSDEVKIVPSLPTTDFEVAGAFLCWVALNSELVGESLTPALRNC